MQSRISLTYVLLCEIGVIALGLIHFGWTIEGLQAITRYSGRLSLFIFSFIFLFHQAPHGILVRILSEKYFLMFAVAHGVHLIELTSYVYFSGVQLIPYRLLGGALAYSFIFAMPWVAKRHADKSMSDQRFRVLTLVYLYYVWFIFVMTYVPRVMGTLPNAGGSYMEFVVLLGWVFLMLGIRLSRLFSKSRVIQRD
jgi:hypothetical protein